MQKKQEILSSVDCPRLRILKACLAGNKNDVEHLLIEDATLINAKTLSTDSSLLHISARKNNLLMCQFLLNRGHNTNPYDNTGKTPYQEASSPTVRQLLVEAHKRRLLETYLTTPSSEIISGVEVFHELEVLSSSDFIRDPSLHAIPDREMLRTAFGVTGLTPTNEVNKKKYRSLRTLFREDIIMTPYYGELLVIHENEQVVQMLEHLRQGITSPEEIEKKLVCFEVRAYLKSISATLALYPFLKGHPQPTDHLLIQNVKKMLICFGCAALGSYYTKCSPQQYSYFACLDYAESTMREVAQIISIEHKEQNLSIVREMQEKYGILIDAPLSSITHPS